MKKLLITLRDYYRKTDAHHAKRCLCHCTSHMEREEIFTEEEENKLIDFIQVEMKKLSDEDLWTGRNEKYDKYDHDYETPEESISGFYMFNPFEKEPRIEWLNKHINLISQSEASC